MKNKIIFGLCFGLAAMFATPAIAQNQTVKGTVVDENGEPVIGASVMVVGKTGVGVVTDFDGNYTLQVPNGAKVSISYIGYITQVVKPGGKVQLKEDSQSLEEVVVVGYGSQKKAHLTGSVATVPMEDIQDLSSAGLASSLDGLINGMSVSGGNSRPGDNAKITIRDVNSFGELKCNVQEPLFVIDGYVYPNNIKVGKDDGKNLGAEVFNNLDPSTIENISVLKDASAAVYGARAANGVIIVTTKKGKLGAPKVSYSGTFGFTDAVSTPKMLNAYQYGRMYNAVTAADPYKYRSMNRTTSLFQADELEAMKGLNYDLLDKYWKTGFTMQHSVNISGATEKASYFASVSYFDQDGNLGRLDYDRWNYRAGVDVKISNHLKANLTVSGDYGKQNKPNVKIGGSGGGAKDYFLLLTHPRYIPEEVGGKPIASFGPSNESKSNDQYYNFPVLQNNGDYTRNMTQTTTINAGVSYDFDWFKPLKGLQLKFTYAKSIYTTKSNEYATDFDVYKMNMRSGSGMHLYTPVAGQDFDALLTEDNLIPLGVANGDISYLSRDMTRTDNYQMNFTASYARKFGDHSINALFSVEKSETESEYVHARRTEPYPFSSGQSNSTSGKPANEDAQFTRAESGTLSYIGRINYTLKDRYLFEFLLRSDASTKFAPKNYWGVFPSASAGWIMSEEKWFEKALPWISFLKIRASFGLTGRDNLTSWQWMKVYSMDSWRGPVFGTSTNGSSLPRIGANNNNAAVNADVHWDKSYKANLGIDLNVLNNRLGITFDAYREWNREMLMKIDQDVPTTVGTVSASTNLGEMDNWGYELSLNWKDKIGKDFKYRIGLNTGYRDNKVLVMDWKTGADAYMQIQKNGRTDVGDWGMQCIGMFRSFQDINEYFDMYMKQEDGSYGTYMGLPKEDVRPGMLIYKDVRGAQLEDGTYAKPNGIVSAEEDAVRLSDRKNNPWGFTLNLGAEYKQFSLTAQIKASWGGYSFIDSNALKFKNNMEYQNMVSIWNPDDMYVYEDIYDGSGNLVMKENRNAPMPNLAYAGVNGVTSSFWRVSGARATLSRLTFAYSVPSALVKKIGLSSVRFNVTGQNLLSFYNPNPDNFMDPLTNYDSYPTLRKFTVGVNVGF